MGGVCFVDDRPWENENRGPERVSGLRATVQIRRPSGNLIMVCLPSVGGILPSSASIIFQTLQTAGLLMPL